MTGALKDIKMSRIVELLAAAKANRPVTDVNSDAPIYEWDKARHFNSAQIEKLSVAMKKVAANALPALASIASGKDALLTSQPLSQLFLCEIVEQASSEQLFVSQLSVGPKNIGAIAISVAGTLGLLGEILDDKESASDLSRKLSGLEDSLVDDMLIQIGAVLSTLAKAAGGTEYKASVPSRCKLEIEQDPKTEFCILPFDIKIGGFETKLNIYLSASYLDCLCANIQALPGKDQTKLAMLEHIGQVRVNLDTVIAETQVNFSQVMSLAPGDIIVFEKKVDQPASVILQGLELFSARLGKSDGHYAIIIEQPLQSAN